MKVIVPYAPGRLHSVTRRVIESYELPTEFIRLDFDDSYRLLLKDLWVDGETVVIIEQDVVPWPGAIEELHHCMGEWCSCAYRLFGGYGVYHHLGCTKLSSELMRKLPHLWDIPRHWNSLDTHLRWEADQVGIHPHPHRPPVIHLSEREIGGEHHGK
jgi:hypothetical protein